MAALLSFTLFQALLSALGALIFGTLLAIAVIRLPRRLARAIEPLLIAPFFMPPLFVVLAVINLFHERFWGLSVFGVYGILLAHWILNIPLVFYLVLRAWRATPFETVMIAENLGVLRSAVEWPVIARTAPGAFAIVMLYSTLSFTIVLIMGGGPKSSTLEIGIYQAIVFDFDLRAAALYGLVQSSIGIALFFIARRRASGELPNFGELPSLRRRTSLGMLAIVVVIGTFIILPLVLTMAQGVARLATLTETIAVGHFIHTASNSLIFAITVSVFGNALALLVYWRRVEWLGWLVAAVSPLVIAVLAIILLRPIVNPFNLGLPIVIFITALAMSPLLLVLWRGAIAAIADEERQLAQIYFPEIWSRLRGFWWPKLRPSLARNLGFGTALAVGDLALFPIFAPNGYENLAILIWRLMARYRIEAALGLGLITLILAAIILALSIKVANHVAG